MQTYYLFSGEGEIGTWKKVETKDIAKILKKERCSGDRWAKAFRDVYATEDGFAGYDVETGEVRSVPGDVIWTNQPKKRITMTSQLEHAIARSRSQNEIVYVEIVASDISDVIAELNAVYDGEIESSTENDGSEGIWGWTEDMAEGQMDWRINVTLVAE